MKILLVNVVYGKGSTGLIVQDLFNHYRSLGHDANVAYGRGTKVSENHVFKVGSEIESNICHFFSKISGNMYGGMVFSTNKLISLIKRIKPDIIHLHCINGYFTNIYRLVRYLKNSRQKVVLTNHADFMFTANCGYSLWCNKWKNEECRRCPRVSEFNGRLSLNRTHVFYKKMSEAFKNMETLRVTAVSPWLSDRVKLSPIFKTFPVNTVLNGINISAPNFTNDENPFSSTNPNHKKVVLYVTANFAEKEKGGEHIFSIATSCPEYLFFVAGPCNHKSEGNVIFLGRVPNRDLAKYYYFADASLLLSKRETFSMVVAESLSCGTPVVGFLSGGPETIAIKDYSAFVDNGNVPALVEALKSAMSASFNKQQLINLARAKYSLETSADAYLKIYETLKGEGE